MQSIPLRSEVARGDQWDLSSLFDGDTAWEEGLTLLKGYEKRLSAYQGRLSTSAAVLKEFLTLEVEAGILDERLGYYAMLKRSEDAGDSANQGRFGRYVQVATTIAAATSFAAPELQAIDAKTMDRFLADEALAEHRIALSKVLRYRPHTLSASEERLLAMQQESAQTASKAFGALNDVDLDFGEVDTPEGPRPLSQSSFGSLLEHPDREVRARATRQFYAHYENHKNTLSALLTGSVQRDVYQAKVRNYPSALEMRLFPDRVPVSVYDNLVSTVRDNLPLLHRYYALRKRVLGLSELAIYDTKVSLVDEVRRNTPYHQAVDTIVEALSPLGEEYTTTLREGLHGGWVDRYENKGKRSGAFSAGSYTGNPYILMNYKSDTLRDTFTLAHEGGHSMHSWYSVRSNPFQHYNYTIFEAEVASTFNEQLLMHHLLDRTSDHAERAFLLSKHLDDILSTLFRQTMFAEFERAIHRHVEEGRSLTVDSLRDEYQTLLEAYFGPGVHIDSFMSLEGLRIPHFYRAFYVYKYATGISAAITLAERVLTGANAAREAYFTFLTSGGSRYPIDSLRVAGVDMERPDAITTAMRVFERRLNELERLLEQ